jgi:RecA/RadA recombinase
MVAVAKSKPAGISKVKRPAKAPPKPIDKDTDRYRNIAKEIGGQLACDFEEVQQTYRVWPVGCFGFECATGRVDLKFGNGGITDRTIIELFGENGTGKSLLLEAMTKHVLLDDPNNLVAILCSEEPDMKRMRGVFGSLINRIILIGCWKGAKSKNMDFKFQLAETALQQLVKAASRDDVKLVAIDSVKALISAGAVFEKGKVSQGKERDWAQSEPGLRANLLEKLFNRLIWSRKTAPLVMINQTTESFGDKFMKMGSYYRPKTPGGRLKEFLSFLRVEVTSAPIFEKKEHEAYRGYKPQIGLEICYHFFKNKYSNLQGNRKVFARFMFNTASFDRGHEVFVAANYLSSPRADGLPYEKIIERTTKPGNDESNSNWYVIEGKKINGKDAVAEYLNDNPDVRLVLERKILARTDELFSLRGGGKEKLKETTAAVLSKAGRKEEKEKEDDVAVGFDAEDEVEEIEDEQEE